MDLFLDDPNNDVDAKERNFAKNLHILAFAGSVVPPFNFILPFIYSKGKDNEEHFIKKHISNVLNFQILILLFLLFGVALFFFIALFYVLLYAFFLMLFQSFYTYSAYTAAKNGHINNYPISLNIF